MLRMIAERKRVLETQRRDKLLETEAGQAEYWSMLKQQCSESSLIYLLEQAIQLGGDVIELGVYRGDSAEQIAKCLEDAGSQKKAVRMR